MQILKSKQKVRFPKGSFYLAYGGYLIPGKGFYLVINQHGSSIKVIYYSKRSSGAWEQLSALVEKDKEEEAIPCDIKYNKEKLIINPSYKQSVNFMRESPEPPPLVVLNGLSHEIAIHN